MLRNLTCILTLLPGELLVLLTFIELLTNQGSGSDSEFQPKTMIDSKVLCYKNKDLIIFR